MSAAGFEGTAAARSGSCPEPDVPWLDAEEQRAWRSYLQATIRLQAELDRGLRAEGLTHAYYEILARLSEAPDRSLRMSALADCSVSSRSRLSHAVARLEAQGLVCRVAAADDRRGQLCRLTDAGFARLDAAAPDHVRLVRAALLDALTRQQLLLLGEIGRAVDDHAERRRSAATEQPPEAPKSDRFGVV